MDIKVIVLTSIMDDSTREKVLAKPVIDYIPKDTRACVDFIVPLLRRLEKNRDHKVLVADDSLTARRYITNLLERQNLRVVEARDGIEALEHLEADPDISLVISDYNMPNMDGIAFIRSARMRFRHRRLAVIGLSASDEHALTAKFLKVGANDFLTKPLNQEEFYCRLHSTLNALDAERQAYQLANTDYLTGCWNRRYFFEHPLAKQHNPDMCLAVLDLDHFKRLNDAFGHLAGDQILKSFAKILTEHFPDDLICRFGGEEFCVLTETDIAEFEKQMFQLMTKVREKVIHWGEHYITFTLSAGIATGSADTQRLLQYADNALYRAKSAGRNRIKLAVTNQTVLDIN